ncbi:hypothetical protein [Brucella sp. LJL56]
MKNPVRNVVVEYKNKRARKGNVSLWRSLDLKSIAREVEADALQAPMHVRAEADLPEPPDNKSKVINPNVVPQIVTAAEAIEEEGGPSVVDAVEPERAIMVPNPVQKPEIIVGRKSRTSGRGVRTKVSQQTRAATRRVATIDIRDELSFLEQENVSLKRELIAKLHAENENLYAMLERAEQRSTLNKR